MKLFFWKQIGNGLTTSVWYERWCLQGPLIRFLTPRDIAREGFTLQSCVADLIVNGTWNWPNAWLAKAPTLGTIAAPILYDHNDTVCWRDSSGSLSIFSVRSAWEALRPRGNEMVSSRPLIRFLTPRDIAREGFTLQSCVADLIVNGTWNWPNACSAWEALRPRGNEVNWFHIVWFSHCIPRHAFHVWLLMRRCPKTQDLLRPWDVCDSVVLSSLRCSLCGLQEDSHEHCFLNVDIPPKYGLLYIILQVGSYSYAFCMEVAKDV
nr:hypothetical protein [Tanacetum cinerariifolium]